MDQVNTDREPAPFTGKPTVAGRLADVLCEQIVAGDLAPGRSLNLDQMRLAHGVSVSSMREAMTRLVALGLVRQEAQKGFAVAPMSAADLSEITTLRAELLPLALRQSIRQGTLDWEAAIMAALYRLQRIEQRPVSATQIDDWEAAHDAFHAALHGACGMPHLEQMLLRLQVMHDRYRRILFRDAPSQTNQHDEHTAIAQAAVEREADRAGDLLRTHIMRTGLALASRLT